MPVTEQFAAALPYFLGRVGLDFDSIELYPWPASARSGADVKLLLDARAAEPSNSAGELALAKAKGGA